MPKPIESLHYLTFPTESFWKAPIDDSQDYEESMNGHHNPRTPNLCLNFKKTKSFLLHRRLPLFQFPAESLNFNSPK
jgi:hypothetical protein